MQTSEQAQSNVAGTPSWLAEMDEMWKNRSRREFVPDKYGVWRDAAAAALGVEECDVTFPKDWRYIWAGIQARFQKASGIQCRGFFQKHDSHWCTHPLCPSCWVNAQLKVRSHFMRFPGPWIVAETCNMTMTEEAIPKAAWAHFTGRRDPRQRLLAWTRVTCPNPDAESRTPSTLEWFQSRHTGMVVMGYERYCMAVIQGHIDGLRFNGYTYQIIPGWGDIGRLPIEADEADFLLDFWRGQCRIPWTGFVKHTKTPFATTANLLKYYTDDPGGRLLRKERGYQTTTPR